MKPIVMFRHRGFLIRVVDNGCESHPYEWTVDGITPSTKQTIRKDALRRKTHHKRKASYRRLRPRYDDFTRNLMQKRQLNNKLKRVYDPTSMPTARGRCSAQDYAYDEVIGLLYPQKSYVWFNRCQSVA